MRGIGVCGCLEGGCSEAVSKPQKMWLPEI